MPIARFQMPDGRIARFEVPAGTTPERAQEMMVAHFSTPAPAQQEPEATAMDRASAVMTGVNRGAGTRMLGLPVDTIVNVGDLLKAGAGTAYQAVSGKTAPDFLLPSDRTQIAGTGDWIEQKLRNAGGASLIDPTGPQDSTSRVLHGLGMGAGGAAAGGRISGIPMTNMAQVRNLTIGSTGGGLGSAATENGASPATSILLSMAPQAAGAAIAGGTKAAARGSEAGRQAMAQRVQDFKNAGVENPSVGLASGRPLLQGVENLLANTPGGIGAFQRSKNALLDGMQAKTAQVRDQASTSYGADVAGRAIQNDLATLLRPRITAGYERANAALDAQIPAGASASVRNTANALQDLTGGIQGAPNVGARFINGRINSLTQDFMVDAGLSMRPAPLRTTGIRVPGVEGIPGAAGRPAISVTRTIDPRAAVNGEGSANSPTPMTSQNTPRRQPEIPPAAPRTVQHTIPAVPASPGVPARPAITVTRTIHPNASMPGEGIWRPAATPTLPYKAVSKLRTEVGKELESNALMADVPRAQWNKLYGSLSEDMRLAARQTDMKQGPQPNNRGPAERSLDRGNALYSGGMSRADKVQPFANKTAPEQAYNALMQSGKENVSTLRAVKKSIGNDARASTAATWIDRLGRASPGNQNELSDVFSPDRLLTNWNTMNPKARAEVLSGFKDSGKVAASMDDIAKAAAMLKDSSKVWANPSGTGANTAARLAIGGTAFGALFNPMVAGGIATGIGGVNLTSRLMTNQKFVTWLAESTHLPSSQTPAQLARLATMANASGDAQFKKDAAEYAASVKK